MKFLRSAVPAMDLNRTILMDETAVYFEDARNQTVDITGCRHVVVRSTGFSSMRITAVLAVSATGRKLPPLLIWKGKDSPLLLKLVGYVQGSTLHGDQRLKGERQGRVHSLRQPAHAGGGCVSAAGFADSYLYWHVAKHDVYGEQFCTSWEAADEDHEDTDDFNLDELHDALDDAALIDE
ncbi:hypothetical protein ON010_g9306 [Phytophthora cinnamomi]|nr:hypothetical protein ON010_g9306 [Phytophthora cinnamomi]